MKGVMMEVVLKVLGGLLMVAIPAAVCGAIVVLGGRGLLWLLSKFKK